MSSLLDDHAAARRHSCLTSAASPADERAAVRWHGRLETEATFLSLAESQLALAALASLCAGERDALEILRRLLQRVRPTVVPRTWD